MYEFSRGIGFGLTPYTGCFTYFRYGNITYLLTNVFDIAISWSKMTSILSI